ncbi:MAG: hypothetical protein KGL46_09850 [Hyphomicrobiales bacterium]|nr:hypothetical protein [Hyphomicrobiales bacterium]
MSSMKQTVANLRASLKNAPAKEPKRSVKAIIADMRADIAKARREKNWTVADVHKWLVGQGVQVTVGTLAKYLETPRRPGAAAKTAIKPPSAGTVGQGVRGPKSSTPAPRPAPQAKARAVVIEKQEADAETVPRSSEFPLRRDRPDL